MKVRQKQNRKKVSEQGSYALAVRVSQPILDLEDKLQVNVFISGYGDIKRAKLAF